MVLSACNSSYSGGWVRRITWTWKEEVAVSRDHATALQPGQQSKILSQKKSLPHSRGYKIPWKGGGTETILMSILSCTIPSLKRSNGKLKKLQIGSGLRSGGNLVLNISLHLAQGSYLQSQYFGRPRWEDCLELGVWDQPGQHNGIPPLQKQNS